MAVSHVATDSADGYSTSPSVTLSNITPASNNLLVAFLGHQDAATISGVTSGWTEANSSQSNTTGNHGGGVWWKVSDGTETSFGCTLSGSSRHWSLVVFEFTGNATSSPIDGSAEGETNVATAAQTIYSGSATPTQNGLALALFTPRDDRYFDATETYSNSFTELLDRRPVGGTNRPGMRAATLAYTDTSAKSCTVTTTDTGDQNYGVLVLIKEAGTAGITGSLSVTLADVTISASGALSIAGSASNTLAAVGLSGAGAVAIDGALTQTLGDLQISSDGTAGFAGITGSLSVALGDASLAASGALLVTGSLAVAIGLSTLAGSGALSIAGASSVTLGDVGAISEGFIGAAPITGSLAQTLDALVAASAGQIGISASAAIQIGDAALSSGGAVLVTGTLAQQLGDLVVAAAASIAVDGSAGITLGVLDLSSSGGPLADITASAAITLDAVAANGSAGVLITGALEELLGEVGISSLGGDIFYIITLDGTIVAAKALRGRIVARRVPRKIVAAKTLN